MKKILICFAVGCLGALANSLTVWFFGDFGITKALHVAIAPALPPEWLYPRIVWGGIWGLVFITPVLNAHPFRKGLLFSLFPHSFNCWWCFRSKRKRGIWGLTSAYLRHCLSCFSIWFGEWLLLLQRGLLSRSCFKNASHTQWQRYNPLQNAHILSCMLRFLIGLRLALGHDLLFQKQLQNCKT